MRVNWCGNDRLTFRGNTCRSATISLSRPERGPFPLTDFLAAAAVLLFATAAATDLHHRRIPNLVALALALLGVVRLVEALASGGGVLAASLDLGVAVLVFLLGAAAFSLRALGGGDVKLLAAGTLWFGAAATAPFLLVTVLAGGVLAVSFVAWQLVLPGGSRKSRPSLPYALAIATGGILTTAATSSI